MGVEMQAPAGQVMMGPARGHWLAQLNVEKAIHNKLPDFNVCGYFTKCAAFVCTTMCACKLEQRCSIDSCRSGCSFMDCRACCKSSSLVHLCDLYGISSCCCISENACSNKTHIPACGKKLIDIKGDADSSFGTDSGGTMPAFEKLCCKTACCCCTQGIVCDPSCIGCVGRQELCWSVRRGAFGFLKPEAILCNFQWLYLLCDFSNGQNFAPYQCKCRGKQLFCLDQGCFCGVCDTGNPCNKDAIGLYKVVSQCLLIDYRCNICACRDKTEVPCLIGLLGVMCYPVFHIDCCTSAAEKHAAYKLDGAEEGVVLNVGGPPAQKYKENYA